MISCSLHILTTTTSIEVMSDLRILEEQQNESRRRLEAAQATKQRRVDQQTELESKLDQLKYHNGQKRAELQNFHALLSEGQKSLQTARVSSEKAGGDLRDFDNLLKASLETKRAMFILQRNQDHLLDVLRDKVGVLERLSRKKEENFDRVKVEFDSVVKIEADLRESIHIASMKNHQIAESTASARTVTFKLEKSLDIAFKNESLLKLELENLSTEADADCKRHDQTEASNSSKVTELEKISDELAINATKLEQEIASSRELFLQCRGKLIELQRNEGHAINELPLDSNDSPVLDTERIRESFLAENESVKDELSATKEFKESISTLKIHLVQLKEQLNDAIKRSTQLSVSIGNAETVELARTEAFENLLHEIDSIRKEVDDKHAVLGEFRVKQNMEIDATKNKFTEISDEVITRREGLTNAKSERSKLNDEIENLQGTYRQLKIDDDRKIEATHQGMENEMEKSEMLKDAADELEKTKEEPETMLFKKGKIEKIKLGILQILEGMHAFVRTCRS